MVTPSRHRRRVALHNQTYFFLSSKVMVLHVSQTMKIFILFFSLRIRWSVTDAAVVGNSFLPGRNVKLLYKLH